MKEKNLPDDINHQSLEELKREVNNIVDQLENEDDLSNSLNNYQKLIKLNNVIEKKFQLKAKNINIETKEKIKTIIKKNDEKFCQGCKGYKYFFKKISKKSKKFKFIKSNKLRIVSRRQKN
jgi:exonuclease VII small subunit